MNFLCKFPWISRFLQTHPIPKLNPAHKLHVAPVLLSQELHKKLYARLLLYQSEARVAILVT